MVPVFHGRPFKRLDSDWHVRLSSTVGYAWHSIQLWCCLHHREKQVSHKSTENSKKNYRRNLHSVCNILIALESFFAIFQDASYFVSFGVVTSGVKFIRYENCFPILIPMALCGEAAQITMVFTGIDRLISVLFPIW